MSKVKGIIGIVMLICVVVAFCIVEVYYNTDWLLKNRNKIKDLFIENHEAELSEAISAYEDYYKTNENFFEKTESGEIIYADEFYSLITKISNLHNEYHNVERMPRDSENWNIWMYYNRNPISHPKLSELSKNLITKCPYCLAEEEGKLDAGELDWTKTSLFNYEISKRINELLILLKNDEMKNLLSEFQTYLKTEECFSEKENKNWSLYRTYDDNKYYVNKTEKLIAFDQEFRNFHTQHCHFYWFGDVGKTILYSYKKSIKSDSLLCPLCYYAIQSIEKGTIVNDGTNTNPGFSYNFGDVYFNGLADNRIFENYCIDKEREKKLAIQKKEEEERLAKKQEEERLAKLEEEKRIAAMPLYTVTQIETEVTSNLMTAKKKFEGQQVKVRDEIFSVDEEKISFYWCLEDVYLPRSELEQLHKNQYITFLATIKFSDRDISGFHFENCKIIKVEEGRSWW